MLRRLLILSAALPMVLSACNDYPVHRLLDSFEVRVTDKLAHDKPVKLDFLWVIDQSASMCQEQRALSAAFEAFTSRLSKLGAIDAQMAVVTAQQAQDKSEIKVIGRFMHKAATAFPPNCMERTKMHCLNNGHCTAGEMCIAGECRDNSSPPECDEDAACNPPHEVCQTNRCVPGCSRPGSPVVC